MQAINLFLIIEPIKESYRKVGSFEMPDAMDKEIRYKKAKIVSVGNQIEGLNEGDEIFYDKNAGHGIAMDDGSTCYVIQLRDVVVVL